MINIKEHSGFSLVELLITLVIIAVLVGIAYPSYMTHMVKVRRSNGVIALMDLAAQLEQYYNDYHSYSGATLKNLNVKNNDFYKLEIADVSDVGFLIKAIPFGAHADKDKCGALVLDNLGNETIGGSGEAEDCW